MSKAQQEQVVVCRCTRAGTRLGDRTNELVKGRASSWLFLLQNGPSCRASMRSSLSRLTNGAVSCCAVEVVPLAILGYRRLRCRGTSSMSHDQYLLDGRWLMSARK
eukprot:scaffold1836_cov204-Alexandrium_tamarense.AAC.29